VNRIEKWLKGKSEVVASPIEIKRGCVYVIEAVEPMSGDAFEEISAYLKTFSARTGCDFLILDYPFKISVKKDQK